MAHIANSNLFLTNIVTRILYSLSQSSINGAHVHAVEISKSAYNKGIGQLQGKVEGLSAHLGDGLSVLVERGVAVDTVVVTGMGARRTQRILDAGLLRAVGATQVVVQPLPHLKITLILTLTLT